MGKLKVHVLLKGLQLKLILGLGREDYERRQECNETNVCKHDEDVKDQGGGK